MKFEDVRKKFLDFFESKKHKVTLSSPMVLKNDPSLMFVNSGMVPFKDFFTGQNKITDKRIVNSQKCLRVSGKHNDLEEVGLDTYHHTFFEMLGNWSFDDYFKEEIIEWSWEFLTKILKIEKDILYVTVFQGEELESLERDDQAYEIWKKYIDEDRILLGNKKDNFWEMGTQGPCGPCSEIHIDLRPFEEKNSISGESLVNSGHPQVIEIWNLVFIQFNRKADGLLNHLKMRHVDTGMGFERLCMVLQGKTSTYDTDIFKPLFDQLSLKTGFFYGKSEKVDVAMRVVSDHLRSAVFVIAEGQFPSSTGAGYVIRRILRRAVRYGFTFLNQKSPFIYDLVDVLSDQMGGYYPELILQKNLIKNVIKEEETLFLKTLAKGLHLLNDIISQSKSDEIPGEKAFELYDTFGFPIDLTALILSEKQYHLDREGFELALKKQKDRSREATKVDTDDWIILREGKDQEFVGYDRLDLDVNITKYRKVISKREGQLYHLVFDLTPFYAEGGGQVGDTGVLRSKSGDVIQIIDTKRENELIVHISRDLPKDVRGTFRASVEVEKRTLSSCNHSATHLLHLALRTILGNHVEQKGSFIDDGGFRFDFCHFSKLTKDEMARIESFVNARISEKIPLNEFRDIPLGEASKFDVMALFGEKYKERVRVIQFGASKELCGGTHIDNTGDIWYFRILKESAVASGVRRIEAITAGAVQEFFTYQAESIIAIKEALNGVKDPLKSIMSLQKENAVLKREIESLMKYKTHCIKSAWKENIRQLDGVNFLAIKSELELSIVKDIVHQMGREISDLFLFVASEDKGSANLVCFISRELTEQKAYDASKIVSDLSIHIEGSGGGQKFFAVAGGKKPSGLDKAMKNVESYLK